MVLWKLLSWSGPAFGPLWKCERPELVSFSELYFLQGMILSVYSFLPRWPHIVRLKARVYFIDFVFNIFRPVFQLFPLYDVPLLFQCDDLFSFCSVPIQNIFVWKINRMWNGQLLFHSNFIDNLDLLNLDLMNSESTELVCELWKFSFLLYIFRKLYHEGMKFLRKKSKKKFYSVWVPDYENANERVFLNPHSFSKNTIQDLN